MVSRRVRFQFCTGNNPRDSLRQFIDLFTVGKSKFFSLAAFWIQKLCGLPFNRLHTTSNDTCPKNSQHDHHLSDRVVPNSTTVRTPSLGPGRPRTPRTYRHLKTLAHTTTCSPQHCRFLTVVTTPPSPGPSEPPSPRLCRCKTPSIDGQS